MKIFSSVELWAFQIYRNVLVKIVNPSGNYVFKVYNRNTRTRCEICSKLVIKTAEQRQWKQTQPKSNLQKTVIMSYRANRSF